MPISSFLAPSAIAKPGVCTSSTRPASPYQGQVVFQTDTNQAFVWNGSAWVLLSTGTANPPGLEFITAKTFTADTPSIDSCFTTTYAHYFITWNVVSSTTGWYLAMRLRAGGVSKQTNYDRANFVATPGGTFGIDSNGTAQTLIHLGGQNSALMAGQAYVYNPQVSGPTGVIGSMVYGGTNYQFAVTQTETYSADGFQFLSSGNSATYTGTIRVYGLKN